MRKFWESLAFWRRWDDRERAVAVKIIGLLVAAISVFVFIGTVSSLFHISMSECTAVSPEMSLRSMMARLFWRASHGQSPTRSMLPNFLIAGPM